MARVTLADVAQRVGVSAKTVSNVVNGTGWVSDAVRERVLVAIRDLGYRPNMAARQLRNGKSGMLAFGIPNLREPYFAEFASRFVDIAHDRGVNVLITQTGGLRGDECAFVEGEGLPAVDGIVLSPLALAPEDLSGRRSAIPLILVGEHGAAVAASGMTHVGIDNIAAARAATEHLLSRGRRRIAVIGVQHEGSTETSRLRYQGYRDALEAAGIEVDEGLLGVVGEFNRAEGSRAIDDLLDRGADFDGVFCFNDTMAFGALYSLGVRGRRVPDDVEVVGFDDIDEGRFSIPSFSTISARTDIASRLVLDALTGNEPLEPGHLEVPFAVVER